MGIEQSKTPGLEGDQTSLPQKEEQQVLDAIPHWHEKIKLLGKHVKDLEDWPTTHQAVIKASKQMEKGVRLKVGDQDTVKNMPSDLRLNSARLEKSVTQYLRSIIFFSQESVDHLVNANKDTLRIGVIPIVLLPCTSDMVEKVDIMDKNQAKVIKVLCPRPASTGKQEPDLRSPKPTPEDAKPPWCWFRTICGKINTSEDMLVESQPPSTCDSADTVHLPLPQKPIRTKQDDELQTSVDDAQKSMCVITKRILEHTETVAEVDKLLKDTADLEDAIDSLVKKQYPCLNQLNGLVEAFEDLEKQCQCVLDKI